jgi:UTP--glucose-1-phosphate uridylyltransferase
MSDGTRQVRKAVIPAAGLGTRFLPISKSVPKEMLPIVDKPVIQFVVEEAIASGMAEIAIVISKGKEAIRNHFSPARELEARLASAGKSELLAELRAIGAGGRITFIEQAEPRGLGHAILCARDFVNGEPFGVLLGDTIIEPHEGAAAGSAQLVAEYVKRVGSYVAVREVPLEKVGRYGIVDGSAVADDARVRRLTRLVEKPSMERTPSQLAVAGRYLFEPGIFEVLAKTPRGHGGEIQLTDAMNALAKTDPVFSLAWRARRYDIGDRAEYAACFIELAPRRADVRHALNEATSISD